MHFLAIVHHNILVKAYLPQSTPRIFHQTVIEHLWSEKARRLEVPLTINGVQTIACSTNQYGAVLTLNDARHTSTHITIFWWKTIVYKGICGIVVTVQAMVRAYPYTSCIVAQQ